MGPKEQQNFDHKGPWRRVWKNKFPIYHIPLFGKEMCRWALRCMLPVGCAPHALKILA